MNYKSLFWKMIAAVVGILGVIALFVAVVDPYFHYHAPHENLHYRLADERYMNEGILSNFEYDAMITGTSMTENFKTSEFDELFGVNSVKTSLEGSTYNEINNLVEIALEENPNLKLVLRGLDSSGLVVDKDEKWYSDAQWPEYLYDENPVNDVKYLLSESAVKRALMNCYMTVMNVPSTTFDEYANWNSQRTFGSDVALSSYSRPEAVEEIYHLTEEEKQMVLGNVQQNLTAVAAEYPDVTFYYYITPVSVLYWDKLHQQGKIEWYIEAEKIAIEEMLQYPNIKLFSFCNYTDVVCDLNYYTDIAHHWEKTNSNLLRQMKNGNYLLTAENYEAYLDFLYQTYSNYDYESIFVSE
ncbi:MAG: hypothetical protein IJZ23_09140 [Roseburia sp.]|nr:hypothetical protein [Roseburia sp.]